MNRNNLLALVTLIALLWIDGGDSEVDIAKRQKGQTIMMKPVRCTDFCDAFKKCEPDCKPECAGASVCQYNTGDYDSCLSKCAGKENKEIKYDTVFDCKTTCKVRTVWGDYGDEADEAKSDEVDIAKRQKGLKILKAWKRDDAEMVDVDEADEDKAQN